MINSGNHESLKNEAMTMLASGYDNKYIELQFAEKGIDDATIDLIISDISKVRKASKRKRGITWVIYGTSAIVAAVVFSFISFNSGSPINFVLWGLGISGMLTAAKGIIDIVMP